MADQLRVQGVAAAPQQQVYSRRQWVAVGAISEVLVCARSRRPAPLRKELAL